MLNAEIVPTFYKINVHAAMTPEDIEKELKPVFLRAHELEESFHRTEKRFKEKNTVYLHDFTDGKAISSKTPFVTVSSLCVYFNCSL